jgi:hypothetical protein
MYFVLKFMRIVIQSLTVSDLVCMIVLFGQPHTVCLVSLTQSVVVVSDYVR